MKNNIDKLIEDVVRDNAKFIIDGGYDSVADYLISTADYSDQGWCEYFPDEEMEFGLTEEQIEEAKNYINAHYSRDFGYNDIKDLILDNDEWRNRYNAVKTPDCNTYEEMAEEIIKDEISELPWAHSSKEDIEFKIEDMLLQMENESSNN